MLRSLLALIMGVFIGGSLCEFGVHPMGGAVGELLQPGLLDAVAVGAAPGYQEVLWVEVSEEAYLTLVHL